MPSGGWSSKRSEVSVNLFGGDGRTGKPDGMLAVAGGVLVVIGLLFVYSSSVILGQENFGSGGHYVLLQLVWAFMGLVVFFLCLLPLVQATYALERRLNRSDA